MSFCDWFHFFSSVFTCFFNLFIRFKTISRFHLIYIAVRWVFFKIVFFLKTWAYKHAFFVMFSFFERIQFFVFQQKSKAKRYVVKFLRFRKRFVSFFVDDASKTIKIVSDDDSKTNEMRLWHWKIIEKIQEFMKKSEKYVENVSKILRWFWNKKNAFL